MSATNDMSVLEIATRIVGWSSALAAWVALWLSWRNSRRDSLKERIALSAIAQHFPVIQSNGTRKLSEERLTIRILNSGRPIEIESLCFRPRECQETLPDGLWRSYSSGRSGATTLERHTTLVVDLSVQALFELKHPDSFQPVRLFLKDGKRLDLKVKELRAILKSLRRFQLAVASGREKLLPQRMVWRDGTGRPIETFEGVIPSDAKITDDRNKPIPEEEERIWRAGRNPQEEGPAHE